MISVVFNQGLATQTAELPLLAGRETLGGLPAGRAPAAAYPGSLAPYGNTSRNARAGQAVPPDARWTVRWRTPLNPQVGADFVLVSGDRVLNAAGQWQLFDTAGQPLAAESSGGPVAIDPLRGLFYSIDHAAYLRASRLRDGGRDFVFLPSLGDTFRRTLIAIRGTRILITGEERSLDPHGAVRPTRSTVQIIDIGEPPRVNENGRLSTLREVGELRFPSPRSLSAASPDVVAVALPGSIHFLDWDAQIAASYRAPDEPRALSLDEAGRAYLLAAAPGGCSLTVLTPAGEVLLRHDFPAEAAQHPPVIGYGHDVFVLTPQRIFALGPSAQPRWDHPPAGHLAGAIVTANDLLITSEGSQIAAWNLKGERKVLAQLDEALATPPALSEAGELLVASRSTLYCLRRQ